MKLLFRIFCIFVTAVMVFGSTARAGMNEYGKGARAIAMGQAQTAACNDGSAIVYNPAALIQARDYWNLGPMQPYLTLINEGMDPELEINGVGQQEGYGPSIDIQLVLPIFKRFVLGAEIWLSTDTLLTVDLLFPPQMGRWTTEHNFGLGTGFAIEVTDKLSIGYTSQGQLAYNGSVLNVELGSLVESILGFSIGSTSDINPAFELDIIGRNSYKLGALYRPFDWMSMGLTYSYRSPAPVRIPVKLAGGSLMGDIDLVVVSWTVSPTTVTGGLALFPVDGLTLAMDLTYALYSQEKKNGMTLESSDPSLASDYPYMSLEDVWWPKFGFEWKDNLRGKFERVNYAVRGGYSYYPSPYPSFKSKQNYSGTIDNDAHFYSGGLLLGYRPYRGSLNRGPAYIALEFFYEYIHFVERTHRNIKNNPAVIVSGGHATYTGVGVSMHW